MAWLCDSCGIAHPDGKLCPYVGMNKEQIQIKKLEDKISRLEEKFKKHRHEPFIIND